MQRLRRRTVGRSLVARYEDLKINILPLHCGSSSFRNLLFQMPSSFAAYAGSHAQPHKLYVKTSHMASSSPFQPISRPTILIIPSIP